MRASIDNEPRTMSQPHGLNSDDTLEMVEPTGDFKLRPDRRPRMEEPLPVKLVTVDDAQLLTSAGLERALDAFYVDLLGFVRTGSPHDLSYRSDNFVLHFRVEEEVERSERSSFWLEAQSAAF